VTALVVTLRLDDASHGFFNDLRTAYFPPARLVVGAHVTLFHAIPAALETALLHNVAGACRATQPFALAIKRLRFLGRGVAYDLDSVHAASLRASLVVGFDTQLTPQDRAHWSPHLTIQNKVAPETARATLEQLRDVAVPAPMTAIGIAIWRYLGGPWAPVAAYTFDPVSPEPGQG
jgi:hypothetical protein